MACTCDGEAFSALPTELTTKPANNDMFGIDNVSVPETQKFSYETLKSLFLKTDENNTGLTGDIQLNDNVKFIAGTGSDFQIYHDDTNSYILNNLLNSKTIMRLRDGASSWVNMATFNPAGPTISISTSNIAHTDNSTHGLNFNSSGHTVIKKLLDCRDNIDMNANFINDTGADNAGLSFSSGDGTFADNLIVTDNLTVNGTTCTLNCKLDMNGDIAMASFNINGTGNSTGGLYFNGTDNGNFSDDLRVIGTSRGNVVRADANFNCAGISGATGIITLASTTSITVAGGIITAWS